MNISGVGNDDYAATARSEKMSRASVAVSRRRFRASALGGLMLLRGRQGSENECGGQIWGGPDRAPAPPAISWPGAPRQGARHVSDTQYRDRRDRHRYRQELVPRRGPRYARRHRAAAKVVAWPGGIAAPPYTALPDRHGSLRRRPSPEPQTRIAGSRCQADAGQICPPL